MKMIFRYLLAFGIVFIFASNGVIKRNDVMADPLSGAWMHQSGSEEQILLLADNYITHTVYSKSGKKFVESCGGTFSSNENKLNIDYEFDTREKAHTGQLLSYDFSVKNNELTSDVNGQKIKYKKIGDGSEKLTGLWHITGRMQDGKVVPIHRTGTRKTIKILSGNRFQWAAIDPGTKQFLGTGGGVYKFENGKYTEDIDFFSRDSGRVGASLCFEGKLEKGEWHHSGLSSKGDKIYEIWSRVKN